MSFYKIKNPINRERIVKEYLLTRQNIRRSNLSRRRGDIESLREYEKIFKPITESQKAIIAPITKVLEDQRSIKYVEPLAITEGQRQPDQRSPSLPESAEDIDQRSASSIDQIPITNLGPIATEYLSKALDKEIDTDTTFGIYNKEGKFYIGDSEIKFDNNDIIIGDEKYIGTRGLWELLINKNPGERTEDDYTTYGKILVRTNAIRVNNDPNNLRPKSSRSDKWKNIVGPIWNARSLYTGKGVHSSDPNELLERFDLLMASKKAGNTGVDDEIVAIMNELFKQGIINSRQYKKFSKMLK